MDEQVISPLIKMAVRASKDPTLLASQFESITQDEGCKWQDISGRLAIDEKQLARLALCRRPNPRRFEADVKQIADYVEMDMQVLGPFLRRYCLPDTAKIQAQPQKRTMRQPWVISRQFVWAAGLVVLVLFVLSAAISAVPAKAEATLIVDRGQATVTTSRVLVILPQKDTVVQNGQMIAVKAGDQISLEGGAEAHLQLYDGSSVDLSESARVNVQELATTRDDYRVHLQQLSGKTVNRVIHLLGLNDRFEITTPSSTVSVRGTVFTVAVLSDVSTFASVENGVVHFVMGVQAVDIHAGEEVLGVVGQQLQVEKSGSNMLPGLSAAALTLDPTATAASPTAGVPVLPTPVTPPTPAPPGTPGDTSVDPDSDLPSEILPEDLPPGAHPPKNSPPKNTPNKPGQVPGKPPDSLPGKGDPPQGGGDPPGQGGDPPGQDKDKNDPPGKDNGKEPPGKNK
jgi:hypothetical protein